MLLGIHNQQYIDPGIGEFKPPTGGLGIDNHLFNPPHQGQLGIGSLPNFSDKPPQGNPGDLPMGQHPLMGKGPVTGSGHNDVLGGFGEQIGGFGKQMAGFNDQFRNINDRLSSMEQGITSLTEKFGTFQQPRQQQNFGMNPFGSFTSYNPFFGGLGMFMRPY